MKRVHTAHGVGAAGRDDVADPLGGIRADQPDPGAAVVAEGVESREQLAQLTLLDCDRAQGFLFAPPLPAERMTELLRLPGRILPEPTTDAALSN